MKKIGLGAHGFIDYALGLLLIIAPALFNFSSTAETWTLVAVGIITLGYCLLTDYRLGVLKIISTPTHLLLDIVTGMFLAISPWLFGFRGNTWAFHLITGSLLVFTSLFTNPRPVYRLIKYRRRKLHKPIYRTYSIR